MLSIEEYIELSQSKNERAEWQEKAFQGEKMTRVKAQKHEKAQLYK